MEEGILLTPSINRQIALFSTVYCAMAHAQSTIVTIQLNVKEM